MNCASSQNLILESLDRSLDAVERSQLASHMADCVACRAFNRMQRAWDAALNQHLRLAKPAPDLQARILQRVRAASNPGLDPARVDLRRAMEMEFRGWQAELSRALHQSQFRALLDLAGTAAILVAAIVVLPKLSLDNLPGGGVLSRLGPGIAPLLGSAVLSAAALAAGAWATIHRGKLATIGR